MMLFLFFLFVSSLIKDCPFDDYFYLEKVYDEYKCKYIPGLQGCHKLNENNTTCKEGECLYGYYWSGSGCSLCGSGAYECPGGISTKCFETYYLNGSKCVSCSDSITGCRKCTLQAEDVICFSCSDGYKTLHDNVCVSCRDVGYFGYDLNAASCTVSGNTVTVSACSSGYALLTDSTYPYCVACTNASHTGYNQFGVQCKEASTAGSLTQTDCNNGYCLYLPDGGEDDEWSCYYSNNARVVDCTYNDSTGYYEATECSAGSSACSPSGSGNTGCYNCQNTANGGSNYATSCSFDSSCSNVVSVDSCIDESKKSVLYDNKCHFCNNECVECVYNVGKNVSVCNKCLKDNEDWEVGHYLYTNGLNSYCEECSDFCHSCSSFSSCDACISIEDFYSCYDGCPNDWKGENCSICKTGECQNGGFCADNGSFCFCNGVWEGPDCSECGIQNNGTCDVDDGSCDCLGHFGSTDCSECGCQNNGTCKADGSCECKGNFEGDCTLCEDGWEGDLCSEVSSTMSQRSKLGMLSLFTFLVVFLLFQ